MTDVTDGIIRKIEAGTERKTKLKRASHIVPWTIAILVMLCATTIWMSSWIYSGSSTPEVVRAPAPPVQTARSTAPDACDNTYRDYHVTSQARPILRASGCLMGWNIQSGGLYLIDGSGKVSGPFYKDSVVGLTSPAVEWRATEGGAIVKARFYR